MDRQKVCAVVVTYNRKKLLKECLNAVLNQSYPVDKLILIDNASTDGTYDMLVSDNYLCNRTVQYYAMDKNLGGAGGFYHGIIKAMNSEAGWIWLMDDDTIPDLNCLKELMIANQVLSEDADSINVSFFASSVYGPDKEFMNVPAVNMKDSGNGYPAWYKYLSAGLVSIKNATFVSVLINADAVKKCGLPDPNFFIWGDDTEYTARLTHFYGDAFLVGKSIAIHKRKITNALTLGDETDPARIKMHHYDYRNTIIYNRYYGVRYARLRAVKLFLTSLKYLPSSNGLMKMKTAMKGALEGLSEYPKFKQYIDEQLEEGFMVSTIE